MPLILFRTKLFSFKLFSLVCEPEHQTMKINPIFQWNSHSLSVKDLHITGGYNPRIVSVSMDHTVVFHSLSRSQPFHRISSDRPILACAMDPAEQRLFLGTDRGTVAMVNLYSQVGFFKCLSRNFLFSVNPKNK